MGNFYAREKKGGEELQRQREGERHPLALKIEPRYSVLSQQGFLITVVEDSHHSLLHGQSVSTYFELKRLRLWFWRPRFEDCHVPKKATERE